MTFSDLYVKINLAKPKKQLECVTVERACYTHPQGRRVVPRFPQNISLPAINLQAYVRELCFLKWGSRNC